MNHKLCHINELDDPGARGFELSLDGEELAFFIVKKEGQVYGYKNKCPHVGINLEWRPDDFLDMDKALIQCSVHGALFTIESGECVGGPCNGNNLETMTIESDDQGNLFLTG